MSSSDEAGTIRAGPGFRRLAGWAATACALATLACSPIDDVVFESATTIALVGDSVSVPEDAGGVSLTLRLERPAPTTVLATFRLERIEAQDNCQQPDFTAAQGGVRWDPGQTESVVQLWVEDDNLAETDERFKLVVDDVSGASVVGSTEIEVTILDNDRDALIDASDHGVSASLDVDQAPALQEALDAARAAGRGVVVLAPGDYLVSTVSVAAGTTLSGRKARLVRPAQFEGTLTISSTHSGADDSAPTLIEGISIDGQRDLQGSYQDWELSTAHLIAISGDPETPGRIRVNVEDVSVNSGTGDGISIGPQSDVRLCNIVGYELWRDVVGLHGGGSSLSLRSLGATAMVGTSGIWMDGETPGFDDTRRVQVELEDVNLSTGDFEATLTQGSNMVLRRVTMDRAPFRLLAPDATVRIYESRIYMGIPGRRRGNDDEIPAHNYWQIPHDVQVIDSTLVVSESVAEEDEPFVEQQRTLALGEVVWAVDGVDAGALEGHQLVFDNCQFEIDRMTVDPDDTVYALRSRQAGGAIIVRSCGKDSGFADWFDPDNCAGCQLEN